MKVIKVEIGAQSGHYFMPVEEAMSVVDGELDGAEVDDSLTLTVCEMTKEEYDALPEFTGW